MLGAHHCDRMRLPVPVSNEQKYYMVKRKMSEGLGLLSREILSGTRCENFTHSALYYLIAARRDQVVPARIRVISYLTYVSQLYFSD